MRKVIFVAPMFRMATLRFLRSVARLDDIQLAVISHEPKSGLPPELRARVAAHYQVGNCLDAGQLAVAARSLVAAMGGVDRMFGALEELQVPIARVRDFLNIEGLGQVAAINFRDKSQMKQTLRDHGVPCARACLATSPEQALDFVKRTGYPLVVKPPDGAGARNTFQLDSDQKLADYLTAFGLGPDRPALFEEFIKGDEHSFESVCIGGEVVWHSLTRYYPNPLAVLKNPWIQWCVLLPNDCDHARWNDIRHVNQAALKALGMKTGLSHMEWFRREDGSIAVSEVGARPPGAQFMTLMSYAHEKDFYHAWAELMVFDRFDAPERKYAAGAAYLRGSGRGRIKAVHGVSQAQKEVGAGVVEARLPKPGQWSSNSYEGDGYVIVRHPDTDVVKKMLQRLITLIRVTYE